VSLNLIFGNFFATNSFASEDLKSATAIQNSNAVSSSSSSALRVLGGLGASAASASPVHPVSFSNNSKNMSSPESSVVTTENQTKPAQEFVDSIQMVKDLYVEDVPDSKIFENAMRGMLEKLDPHSSYLDEKAYQELQNSTEGEFTGLGIEVIMKKNLIYVVTPMDGSPAEKGGILSGDYIVRIDDKAVTGLSLDEAVDLMRGKTGTTVHLVIMRENQKDPIHLTLTRGPIDLQSVKGELLENNYAYIRISGFQTETAKTLDDLLISLAKQSQKGRLKGVILDLRNNPGGLLQAAVDVSDIFLDVNKAPYNKVIVSTRGRSPDSQSVEKVTTPDHTHGVPVVVLINHGTASAAEIVAAALQDDNRAVLVGTRSFGKGSVQTVIPLLDGKTAVKLTTARYYTPKGTAIQAIGVTPDVTVEQASVSHIKTEDNMIDSEGSLPGSLNAEQKKTPETQAALADSLLNDQENQKLIKKDFQLYQALMLLKGTVSLEQ
jgi:carboxyl-terminal processing protease